MGYSDGPEHLPPLCIGRPPLPPQLVNSALPPPHAPIRSHRTNTTPTADGRSTTPSAQQQPPQRCKLELLGTYPLSGVVEGMAVLRARGADGGGGGGGQRDALLLSFRWREGAISVGGDLMTPWPGGPDHLGRCSQRRTPLDRPCCTDAPGPPFCLRRSICPARDLITVALDLRTVARGESSLSRSQSHSRPPFHPFCCCAGMPS